MTDVEDVAIDQAPSTIPVDIQLEWLRSMMLIRSFEEVSLNLAGVGKIPGGMHSAAGQEAIAVGSIRALEPHDIVCSSHRSHHHALAKGLTPREIMAELYGKETGCLGGRGGHMHLADFARGLYGSNGIVGGGVGIALGAALGARVRRVDQVALCFFGDGGANTGRIWEFINLAVVWQLPLVVICENNLYAVETHIDRVLGGGDIAARARGFGITTSVADGQDIHQIYELTRSARHRASEGGGPSFIEAKTYRYDGHNNGDPQDYRQKDEVEQWRRTADPIVKLSDRLKASGQLSDSDLTDLEREARRIVDDSVEFSEQSPWPDPSSASTGVYANEEAMR